MFISCILALLFRSECLTLKTSVHLTFFNIYLNMFVLHFIHFPDYATRRTTLNFTPHIVYGPRVFESPTFIGHLIHKLKQHLNSRARAASSQNRGKILKTDTRLGHIVFLSRLHFYLMWTPFVDKVFSFLPSFTFSISIFNLYLKDAYNHLLMLWLLHVFVIWFPFPISCHRLWL